MPPKPEDFTRIYRIDAEAMLLYFQRRVYDAELATDLLAETFAMAIERGHQYKGCSDEELSAWIWTIARSQLSAAERRDGVERRRLERLGVERRRLRRDEVERIEELAGVSMLHDRVIAHLNRLPASQRDALRLRLIEELDYGEVAERLGISQQTARARVSRGLRELRRRVAHDPRAQEAGEP